jgi:hypothetical protein
MRHSHMPAPLHRIEYWNDSYFRPASLWEVGTYILVQHHNKEGLCNTLQFQKRFLESQQLQEDEKEQHRLRNKRNDFGTTEPVPDTETGPGTEPEPEPEPTHNDDANADAIFEAGLNNLLKNPFTFNIVDENIESDDATTDIHNMTEYLGPYLESYNPGPDPDAGPDIPGPGLDADSSSSNNRPSADGLNNAYVRVIHTNGIHHIGMVTCTCGGHDKIPLDLFASRLLPASFFRIRTIFTAQLMDYFRLCNLELKASAYQFYQLIRRLTLPMGNSEMVNLYHEFRRMSRIWRWMKKLKWAGYGHNQKDHINPPTGSLSIFCPTCPQPHVNLPDDWKLDKNR